MYIDAVEHKKKVWKTLCTSDLSILNVELNTPTYNECWLLSFRGCFSVGIVFSSASCTRIHVNNFTRWNRIKKKKKNTALANMRVSTSKLGRFEEYRRCTITYTAVYAWFLLSLCGNSTLVRCTSASGHCIQYIVLIHIHIFILKITPYLAKCQRTNVARTPAAHFRSTTWWCDCIHTHKNSASFVYECHIRYVHTATRSTIWIPYSVWYWCVNV